MKKILIVLACLLALCLTLGAVSADDNWHLSFGDNSNGGSVEMENNELELQDIDFIIPDGYVENETERLLANDTDDGNKISKCVFQNGDKQIIVKVVFSDIVYSDDDYTPAEEAEAKNITNQSGYYYVNSDGESVFDYVKDGKLVEIIAPDEQTISSIIVDD